MMKGYAVQVGNLVADFDVGQIPEINVLRPDTTQDVFDSEESIVCLAYGSRKPGAPYSVHEYVFVKTRDVFVLKRRDLVGHFVL